jgi:hypothetical protein
MRLSDDCLLSLSWWRVLSKDFVVKKTTDDDTLLRLWSSLRTIRSETGLSCLKVFLVGLVLQSLGENQACTLCRKREREREREREDESESVSAAARREEAATFGSIVAWKSLSFVLFLLENLFLLFCFSVSNIESTCVQCFRQSV